MILKSNTVLFVVGRDGMSKMTLSELVNSFKGGTTFDDVTITTDEGEAKDLNIKAMAVKRLLELAENMTAWQATEAVTRLQAEDDLMETHEEAPSAAHVPVPLV